MSNPSTSHIRRKTGADAAHSNKRAIVRPAARTAHDLWL